MHLIVRAGLPWTAGNLVTAQRLASGLRASGLPTRILSADALSAEPRPGPADIVHALHAKGAGLPALDWAGPAPVVWTFTGTDLDAAEIAELAQAAPRVGRLVVFHEEAAAEVRQALPAAVDRVRVIPPGVALPPADPGPSPSAAGLVLLLPAGIRPVKDPDLALTAAVTIADHGLPVQFWIAGPARDPAFHAAFLDRLGRVPFAHYLGEIPPQELAAWYASADLVLNTSRREGLANAVLEAMAHGRAVLATDISGNRAAIRHGRDGWLASAADLPAAAVRLAQDAPLRARLGAAARQSVAERFALQSELRAHLALYRDIWAESGRREAAP